MSGSLPSSGVTFNAMTEVGVVQAGGGSVAGAQATVTDIQDAHDAQIEISNPNGGAAFPFDLDATAVSVTAANPVASYTTSGTTDAGGSDRDGLGGITVAATTEYDTVFTTDNVALNFFGVSTLLAKTYYLGTDGTHALVESQIVFPSTVEVGNNGTIVLDEVLSTNPFITSTDATAVDYTFDLQGAVVPCFLRGTMIATPGGEVAVEALGAGDLVTTASGAARAVRWIGRRAYGAAFVRGRRDLAPIAFAAGSIAEGRPSRRLRVSPEHAMLVDGVLVPAACLVNGVSIVRDTRGCDIEYFHVELDTHDVLIADGAFSESFVDCDSIGMFQNAAERRTVAPGAIGPCWTFCAPRVEDGTRLDAIRSRLAMRAGPAAGMLTRGAVAGRVDTVSHAMVSGWAVEAARPETPVVLEVLVDGGVIGRAVANRARPDVRRAGLGGDRSGFVFEFATPLVSTRRHEVSVRVAGSGAGLDQGVSVLERFEGVSARERDALERTIERADQRSAQAGLAALDAAISRLEATRRTHRMPGSPLALGGPPLALAMGAVDRSTIESLLRLGFRVKAIGAAAGACGASAFGDAAVEVVSDAEFGSIEAALAHFGIEASLVSVGDVGTVTRYAALIRTHCTRARLVMVADAVPATVEAQAAGALADAVVVRGDAAEAALAASVGSATAPRVVTGAALRRAG